MDERDTRDPLGDLGERLERARRERRQPRRAGPDEKDVSESRRGLALGFRIGLELVVAVVVGVAVGWAFDKWLGTRPVGMIVFFFLGVGAGMTSVYRVVTGMGMAVGYKRGKRPPAGQAPAKDAWDDED